MKIKNFVFAAAISIVAQQCVSAATTSLPTAVDSGGAAARHVFGCENVAIHVA